MWGCTESCRLFEGKLVVLNRDFWVWNFRGLIRSLYLIVVILALLLLPFPSFLPSSFPILSLSCSCIISVVSEMGPWLAAFVERHKPACIWAEQRDRGVSQGRWQQDPHWRVLLFCWVSAGFQSRKADWLLCKAVLAGSLLWRVWGSQAQLPRWYAHQASPGFGLWSDTWILWLSLALWEGWVVETVLHWLWLFSGCCCLLDSSFGVTFCSLSAKDTLPSILPGLWSPCLSWREFGTVSVIDKLEGKGVGALMVPP